MKAESLVMVGLQTPMTLFGIPVKLFGLVSMGIAAMMVLAGALGLGLLAITISIVAGALGIFYAYRLGRNDPHADTTLFLPQRFWKGKASRELITGCPHQGNKKRQKKRRSMQ